MKTFLAPLFFVYSTLLASCSGAKLPLPAPPQDNTPPGDSSPYAGGQQYPWTERLESAVDDPYAAGRSYPWFSPTAASSLKPLGPADGQNFLSGLQWTSATNTWGPVELDRSNGDGGQNAADGSALSVGGRTFAKGLGVHAASEIRYALGGQCNTFTARVGVDDEVGARGSVQFSAFGDGRMLYDSGPIRGSDPARQAMVDLRGVQTLRLSATDAGDGLGHDHAEWADARLQCATAVTGQPGTLDPGFGEGGRSSVGGVATVTEDSGALVVLGGQFGLTRLSSSGVVLARGAATLNSAAPLNGAASALALQPDGALIAVGYADGQMVALRYHPDLTLDSGFGVGGVVRLELGVAASQYDSDPVRSAVTAVTVAPDGQIMLAGYAARPFSPAPGVTLSDDDFALVRLNSDGKLDFTFGESGAVTTPLNALLAGGDASTDKLYGVALQPDGKIVVAGEAQYEANNYSSVVARYLGTGKLDPSFSGDGIALGGLGERSTFHAVAVEKGGTVLLGGGTGRFFTSALLQRFSPAGEAGTGVRFQFRVPKNAQLFQTVVTALLPQPDGRVVLGGYAGDTTYVSRFGADLTQELTFGAAPGGGVPVGSGSLIALTQDAERRIIATTAQFTATGIEGDGTVRLFP
ncbi:Glycosyl hydrolase family 98 putative carbohydrate-binding module domain-containing protein [Deinococcus saxicola]|uniref:NPCBM/NEW2 domain-containing protein n=1 Tax=Deinococcus saxicola TaxID=249406 RepID=UPI0039EF6ACC